jgi:hypothetical protein
MVNEMKNIKKITALALAVVLVLAAAANVWGRANEGNGDETRRDWPNFGSVTGMVTGIYDEYGYRIRIEAGQAVTDFNVVDSTFILGEKPKVGDTITGFYDANRPIIMIYPTQYTAVVIVNGGDYGNVFVDRFHTHASDNDEMLSADGRLRLNPANPDTKIVSQGGQDATGWDLDGRLLVVAYDLATRSIPPLAFAPEKIIVMYETAVHPGPAYIGDDYGDGFMGIVPPIGDISDMDLYWNDAVVVEGVVLPGVGLHTEGRSVFPTHVPLRAVAEHLDPEVVLLWDNGRAVIHSELWGDISFRVGSSVVTVNGRTVLLSQPTVLVGGRTMVPFGFFKDALGMNNAYFEGGVVFIDSFEKVR